MVDRAQLGHALRRDGAGFTHFRAAAETVLRKQSAADCLTLARELSASTAYQDRMFATLVLGVLAATLDEAFVFLETNLVTDDNWRVQEMLARAFDQYCKDRGRSSTSTAGGQ